MLIPLKFKVHNMFQHEDREFEYRTGSFGITGPNAGGKSNMFRVAQLFAWTGELESGITKEDAIRHGCDSGFTEVTFMDGSLRYRLRFSLPKGALLEVKNASGELVETLRTAEPVKQRMRTLLGVGADMFEELLTGSQTDILGIIRQTPSVRMKFLQKVAGLNRVQQMQAMIQERIESLPASIDRTADIAAVVEIIEQKESELAVWVKEGDRIADSLSQLTETFLATTGAAKQDLTAIFANLLARQSAEHLVIEKHAVQECLLKDGQRKLELMRSIKDTPTELTKEDNELLGDIQSNKAQERKIAEWQSKLAALAVVTPPELPTGLASEVSTLEAAVARLTPVKELAANATCPTCGITRTELTDKQKADALLCDKAQELLIAKRDMLRQAQAIVDKTMAEYMAYTHDREQLTSLIHEAKLQLLPLPSAERCAAITAHYVAWFVSAPVRENNKRIQDELHALELRMQAENAQLKALEAAPTITKEMREYVEKTQAAYNELVRRKDTQVKATIMLKAAIDAQKQLRDTYAKEHERGLRVHPVKQSLLAARDALHWNALPKLVVQSMLAHLNSCLSWQLSQMDATYTAEFDSDFNLVATKGGYRTQARHLSGGESMLLAISLRLALYEFVGCKLPLLVLDEPTAWLDDDHVDSLATMLRGMRALLEKGTHMHVITHEPKLLPAMSRVFDISSA